MDSPKKNKNPERFLIRFKKQIGIIANLSIIFGVFVTIFAGFMAWKQYDLAKIQNQKRIEIEDIREQKKAAIEVIREENNPRFIKAYTRIKTIYAWIEGENFDEKNFIQILSQLYPEKKYPENFNFVVDDINLTIVHYTNVAMLYFNKIADSELLYGSIYQDLRTFSKILDKISKKIKINTNNYYFELLLNDFITRDWSQEKLLRKNNQDKYTIYLKPEEVIHEK